MTSRNLKICSAVAGVFGIETEAMLSKSRRQPAAFARMIAVALCYERDAQWKRAAETIAAEFGIDRTTVLYARKEIYERKHYGANGYQAKILACEEAVRQLNGK